MSKQIQRLVNGADGERQVQQVQSGAGKAGQPLVVKAQANVTYELKEVVRGNAPDQVLVRRKGKNLEIVLEVEGRDGEAEWPADIIVEDYFDVQGTRLVGVAEDGNYYTYVPQEGESDLLAWNLDDTDYSYHSLGYLDASAVAWWPLLVGGLLVGALAGGGGDDEEVALPVAPPPPAPEPEPEPVVVESVEPGAPGTGDDAVPEGSNLVYTVTLSGPGTVATTLPFSWGGGTATEGLDYTVPPTFSDGVTYNPATGTITVPPGVGSFTVTVPTVNDTLYEPGPNETVPLVVGGVTGTGQIIDDDKPVVTVNAPDETRDTTPTITGTTNQPVGSTVTVVVSSSLGTQTLTTTVQPGGTFTVTPSAPLPAGPYTAVATVTDPAGNVGNATDPGSVVIPDTTPPQVTVSAPDNTPDTTPIITGTTDQPPGTTVTVTITDNTGTPQTVTTTVQPGGTFTVTPGTPLPEGPYTVVATVTDPAGNVGAATDPGSILTPDTTAPVVTVDAPDNTPDTTPTITGTTDQPVGSTVTLVITDSTGTEQTVTTPVLPGGVFEYTPTTPMPEGPYEVTATVTDPAGNVGTDTDPGSIDTSLPLVTVEAPDSTPDTTPTITGTTDQPVGSTVTLVITDSTGTEQTVTTPVLPGGVFEYTPTTPMPEGPYEVTATVTDPAGNVGTDTDPGSIQQPVIESVEPGAPGVDGDEVVEGVDLVYTVTLSEAPVSPATYPFSLGAGTATEGLDYTVPPTFSNGVTYDPVAGTITVPAGVIDFTVTVPTIDDTVYEPGANETTPLTIGGVSGVGQIIDNEALTVAIGDATAVNEGADLEYTVTLSGGTSTSDIEIPLTYAGTATPVLDYDGQPVVVTILAGTTSATVTVPTLGDNLIEGTETVVVNLGAPSFAGVTVTDGSGTGNILEGTPSITNLTPQASGGDVTVDEDDLAAGSDTTKESLTQSGDFTISAPDGLASLTVGGTAVVTGGVFTATAITTPLGNTLNVTGYNPATGMVSYTYTLNAAEAHTSGAGENALFENLAVVLTDTDGSSVSSTLSARIVDDVPTAVADSANITEDAAYDTVSGNVRTNDTQGADTTAMVTAANPTLTYGSLSLSSNGAYTYTLNNANPAVTALRPGQSLTDTYTYTLTDADGDTSTAVLTVTINGANDAPVAIADTASVKESGGNTGDGGYLAGTPTATSNVLTNDTDADVGDTKTMTSVNGTAVAASGTTTINGTYGTLAIASDGSYTYTLDNTRAVTQALPVGSSATETFNYVMRDGSNVSSSSALTVTVNGTNDAPVVGDTSITTVAGLAQLFQFEGGGTPFTGASGAQFGGGPESSLSSGPYIGPNTASNPESMIVTNDATGSGGTASHPINLWSNTTVNLTAGTSYTFTYDAMSIFNNNEESQEFRWVLADATTKSFVQYIDASQTWYNTWEMPDADTNFASGNNASTWTNYSFTFNAASSGNYVLALEWKQSYFVHTGPGTQEGNQDMVFDRMQLSQAPVTVNSLMNQDVTDVDAGSSLKGWAFTTAATNSTGSWQYSTNGGSTWVNMNSASTTQALFLQGTDLIRWTGQKGTNTQLSAVAVDNTYTGSFDTTTTGTANVSVTGGNTPFSAQAATLPANMAPVVLDMNLDGVISYQSQLLQLGGSNQMLATAWAGQGDGVLVWDKHGDGQVHDSSQFAFGQSGVTDLEGLAATFDTDEDGQLDADDAQFDAFDVWVDGNHNGVVDAGEMRSLAEAGIVSIDLSSDGVERTPANGVTEFGQSTATLADGSAIQVADAAFQYVEAQTVEGSLEDDTLTDVAGANRLSGGGGADTFVWGFGGAGAFGNPVADIIDGFQASGSFVEGGEVDRLDLSGLLANESQANLNNYLNVSVIGGDTVIRISSNGGFVGESGYTFAAHDQTIVLHGVDANAWGGSLDSSDIVEQMLARGQVVIG